MLDHTMELPGTDLVKSDTYTYNQLMHRYDVWGTHRLIPSCITTESYLVLKNNAIRIVWWIPSKFHGVL